MVTANDRPSSALIKGLKILTIDTYFLTSAILSPEAKQDERVIDLITQFERLYQTLENVDELSRQAATDYEQEDETLDQHLRQTAESVNRLYLNIHDEVRQLIRSAVEHLLMESDS